MLTVLIPPQWLEQEQPGVRTIQGDFTLEEIKEFNDVGFNAYYYPNYPKLVANPESFLTGKDIDIFEWVYVDMDLKDGNWASKDAFLEFVSTQELAPTKIVDSGGGVHVYFRVTDLDAKSFLQINRRLARLLNTDLAVSKVKQLLRLPNTINTKLKDNPRPCEVLFEDTSVEYTTEQLSKWLPVLTLEDKNYCDTHYNKTFSIEEEIKVNTKMPQKFGVLMASNTEIKDIWTTKQSDRSGADFRLGHIMFGNGFTKEEAMSVLVNSAKALERAPTHRISYAKGIVDQIWTFEEAATVGAPVMNLSSSVEDILKAPITTTVGTPFSCNPMVDGTHAGFKLGQVFGLVGGSGIGKTSFSLNLFMWFVQAHSEYTHFFVSLEQPVEEIAQRWKKMCGDNKALHSKVHILGNYNADGSHRNLSLKMIQDYILDFQKKTGNKVGCVVLDHIGILAKSQKNGESQGLIEICQKLKVFANEIQCFFVVQSQTNRDKAGIGDVPMDKGAAYGTTTFEWYVDYLVTIWAPLKRIYSKMPNMTVTAFKYCKIRFKNVLLDRIQEDERMLLMYDPTTEHYNMLTQEQQDAFPHWNKEATKLRNQDAKTDTLEYKSSWSLTDKRVEVA